MSARWVFVHGFLGAATMWGRTLAALGAGDVTTATLPGHGPEPWMPDGDFHAVAQAFSKRLALGPDAVLVGYSMGARVALAMASAVPGLRAVLIGGDPGIRDGAQRAERARWDDAQADAVERDGVAGFAGAWASLPIFETQRKLSESVRAARQRERLGHTARGIAWAMRTLGTGRMPSYWGALDALGGRCLLVTGALDEKFTAIGRASGRAHAVVEGSGHDVALEAPDALATLLAGFERDTETP